MLVKSVPLPPQELIFMDRDAISGFQHGLLLTDELQSRGANVCDGTLLDIGCGWGRLAYGLLERGFGGRYIGVDIVANRIAWLQREFAPRQPRFSFHHFDVANDRYNKNGSQSKIDFNAVMADQKADTVILLSIFTHLYEKEIIEYLATIRGLVSNNGLLVFTCFLYDGVAQGGIAERKSQFTFAHPLSERCRVEKLDEPHLAVAYTEQFVCESTRDAGFECEVFRGSWSGLEAPNGQDWVVARPR